MSRIVPVLGAKVPKVEPEVNQTDDFIFSALREGSFEVVDKWVVENEDKWNRRDVVGANIMHICFLFNRIEEAKKLHSIMQAKDVNLLKETYTGDIFGGESCLHIAVVNNNLDAVKFCLENDCPVDALAKGSFFCKGGDAYYGQLAYHFAAYFGYLDIMDAIAAKMPDAPYLKDMYGNTALHMSVKAQQWEAYRRILQVHAVDPPAGKDDISMIRNQDGLTPFLLACSLGDYETFASILQTRRTVVWKYGKLTRYAYDLSELDTYLAWKREGQADTDNVVSGVQLIIEGNHSRMRDMLHHAIISKILSHKWASFARKIFLKEAFFFFAHLIMLLVAIVLRPSDSMGSGDLQQFSGNSPRLITELLVLAFTLLYIVTDIKTILQQGGITRFFEGDSGLSVSFQFMRWLHFSCIIISAGLRLGGSSIESLFVAVAPIFGWLYMLYFARASKTLGVVVCTVYEMFLRDVSTWIVILLMFLIGFTQGLYTLIMATGEGNFISRMVITMQGTLGNTDFSDDYDPSWINGLFMAMLITYFFVVNIILVNLLIAMMGNTFDDILGDAQTQWLKSLFEVTLEMEKFLTDKEREIYRCGALQKHGALKGKFALEITTATDTSVVGGENVQRETLVDTETTGTKMNVGSITKATVSPNVQDGNADGNSRSSRPNTSRRHYEENSNDLFLRTPNNNNINENVGRSMVLGTPASAIALSEVMPSPGLLRETNLRGNGHLSTTPQQFSGDPMMMMNGSKFVALKPLPPGARRR